MNNEQLTERILFSLNPSAVTLTDYQTKKTIALKSGMQANFGDLRFTTPNGTNIPYWIESKTDSVSADVWLKIPSISTTTGAKVWMYYGNPNLSSASSGVDTFIAFDDFSTDQLGSYWLGDTTLFTVSGGKLTENDNNTWNNIYHQINLASSENWSVYVKTTTDDNRDEWMGIAVMDNTDAPFTDNDASTWWSPVGAGSHRFAVTGSSTQQTTIADNTEYEIELTKIGTTYSMRRDGSEIFNTVQAEFANTYLHAQGFDGGSEIDIIYMRKYSATEPTWGADGAEQHQRRTPQFIN